MRFIGDVVLHMALVIMALGAGPPTCCVPTLTLSVWLTARRP
jgi:hypothetical protein